MVTDFLLCYPNVEFIRGYKVNNQTRPDAELYFGKSVINVEIDTGQQSYKQVRSRQRRAYLECIDPILYVTSSERRLRGLIRESVPIHAIALFTTLQRVLEDPDGEVWEDAKGNRCSLTR